MAACEPKRATASALVIGRRFTPVNRLPSTPVTQRMISLSRVRATFPERLREALRERELAIGHVLTQNEIGKVAGVGRAAVNHWFKGKRIATGMPLICLSEYLG